MSQFVGIGDRPLENFGQEQLGVSSYGRALAQFVRQCDTPLTIGLQGDWGSGKTSLMKCIDGDLKEPAIKKIWVNTWAYAQLGEESVLFLSVLGGVVDALSKETKDAATKAKDILRSAVRIGLGFLRFAAATQGGDTTKMVADLEEKGAHTLAFELKEELGKLVRTAAGSSGRVVLFVDDLDRIPPPRAVQILEALKNFLDVPGLVTVLACDYGVISRGLSARMGVGEAELGRSFFDKIIQVPFRMPTHVYRASGYVQQLLKQIGVDVDADEATQATDLLTSSVGLNPRALKRHVNTLLLLKLVAEQNENLKQAMRDPKRPMVLLGLIAMEAAYPALHAYLARLLRSGDANAPRELLDGGRVPGRPETTELAPLIETPDGGSPEWKPQIASFLRSLRRAVNLDGDEKICDNELAALRELMVHSGVSSVGTAPPERESTDLLLAASDLIKDSKTKEQREAWKALLHAFAQLGFEAKAQATKVHLRRRYLNETGNVRLEPCFAILKSANGPIVELWSWDLQRAAHRARIEHLWAPLDAKLGELLGRQPQPVHETDYFQHRQSQPFASNAACGPLIAAINESRAFFDADWTKPAADRAAST